VGNDSWFSSRSAQYSPSTPGREQESPQDAKEMVVGYHGQPLHGAGEAAPYKSMEPERGSPHVEPIYKTNPHMPHGGNPWNHAGTYDAVSPGPAEPMRNPYSDGDIKQQGPGNKHDDVAPIFRDPMEEDAAVTDALGNPIHDELPLGRIYPKADYTKYSGRTLSGDTGAEQIPNFGDDHDPVMRPDTDTQPLMDLRMHNFRAPRPAPPWDEPSMSHDPSWVDYRRQHFADADIGWSQHKTN